MSLPSRHSLKLTRVKVPQAENRNRKRKRSQDEETPLLSTSTPSQKRPRASPSRSPVKHTIHENTAVGVSGKEFNPIDYWRKGGTWPMEYFDSERNNMSHLLARKKSLSSLRDKQSEASSATRSSATPSDQKLREAKSTSDTRPSYETVLATTLSSDI